MKNRQRIEDFQGTESMSLYDSIMVDICHYTFIKTFTEGQIHE